MELSRRRGLTVFIIIFDLSFLIHIQLHFYGFVNSLAKLSLVTALICR